MNWTVSAKYVSLIWDAVSGKRKHWIVGVGHSVEGTKIHRKLVNYIVVGVVLGFDEPPKPFLVFSAVMIFDQLQFPA